MRLPSKNNVTTLVELTSKLLSFGMKRHSPLDKPEGETDRRFSYGFKRLDNRARNLLSINSPAIIQELMYVSYKEVQRDRELVKLQQAIPSSLFHIPVVGRF